MNVSTSDELDNTRNEVNSLAPQSDYKQIDFPLAMPAQNTHISSLERISDFVHVNRPHEEHIQHVVGSVEKLSENISTFEHQVQNITNLEKKIVEYQAETNFLVERIHDQLKLGIQTINSDATLKYEMVSKEANGEIVKLQKQIERIVQNTNSRQHQIYEETCMKTQQEKVAASMAMQNIKHERSAEMTALIADLRQQKIAAGLPVQDMPLSDVPSYDNSIPINSSSGSADIESREGLIAEGMAMYQFSQKQDHSASTTHPLYTTSESSVPSQHTTSATTGTSDSAPIESHGNQAPLFCEHAGCEKRPSCNVSGATFGRFCGAHKLSGMINVTIKRCETAGCNKMPGFNFEGESERRFCASCKLDGMVKIAGSNSQINATILSKNKTESKTITPGNMDEENAKMQSKKRLQLADSLEKSTDQKPKKTKIKGGRCEAEGCIKHPSFNVKGMVGGRFCSAHKEEGMVDVISKRCEECNKQAAFNYEGQTRGRFCSGHKALGMINVKDKLCEMVGCSKYPTANFEGQSGRRFCTTHKLDGMINFTNKRCEAVGCVKHPKFNFPGKSGRRFCGSHKLEGMVSIS